MTVLTEKALNEDDPGALAGARRVGVIVLEGKNDDPEDKPAATALQVTRLRRRFRLSLPLAMVIADIAFSTGRAA